MKNIIKKLYSIVDILNVKIEKREDTFYDRSDKWQESEKGEEYENKTYEIESIKGEVQDIINQAEELL